MNVSRLRGAPALAGLLLAALLVTAFQAPPPAPVAPPSPQTSPQPLGATAERSPTVSVDGQLIPVPVSISPSGPLFGLEAITRSLGGTVAQDDSGEGLSLTIDQTEIVLGIGSAIITVGESIVSLTQPPVRGEGGILVPVDFLRKTYGDLQGYSVDWRPEASRLLIVRRGARELSVLTDVVHQQGITTVVLQFTEMPRYRVERQPGVVTVLMTADRLSVPLQKEPIVDPLVQDVAVSAQQIRVQLMPGVEAQSYILENPFRIVFDVHKPSSVQASPSTPTKPNLPPGVRTIVIDPGHGGGAPGAIGPSGVKEKDLTLILARDLEARLEQAGMRVVLTRNEDADLPFDTRTAIANQNKADLFISIHLNSSFGSGAHGTETYFLSTEATDQRAAQSAEAENAANPAGTAGTTGAPDPQAGTPATPADTQAMEDLQLILWDLAQSHHLSESQRFANLVQGELNQTLQLRDRGVKQAPFRVLMGANMPAVLVELGFISNPDEEKKLQDSSYRAGLIEALVRSVQRYKASVEGRPDPTLPPPAPPAIPQGTPAQPLQTPPAPGAPRTP